MTSANESYGEEVAIRTFLKALRSFLDKTDLQSEFMQEFAYFFRSEKEAQHSTMEAGSEPILTGAYRFEGLLRSAMGWPPEWTQLVEQHRQPDPQVG